MRLHVAYLVRYLPSPSETFVLDEAMALEDAGARVSLWVLDRVPGAVGHARFQALERSARVVPRPSSLKAWAATLALPSGPTLRRVSARWAESARPRDLRRVAWLARRFRRERVDVVRVHHAAETARFGSIAGQLAGTRTSIAVHGRDLFVPVADLGRILRDADHVSTITPLHRDRLLRAGVRPEGVQLLPCAVPLVERASSPPKDWTELRLLSVGRLVPKKGHALLFDACAQLAQKGVVVRLTVVGDGAEGPRLRGLSNRLRSSRFRVDFRGSLPSEAVFDLLLNGDFHAFALACCVAEDGDRDGLPVSLLEAASHGLPIVTSALGGFDFEFGPESGALLVPAPDGGPAPRDLSSALARIHREGPDGFLDRGGRLRSAIARRPSPAETAHRLLARLGGEHPG